MQNFLEEVFRLPGGSLPREFSFDEIREVTTIFFTVLALSNSDIALKELTLNALLHTMRGDKRIFDAFRPTSELISKIKLHELAMNT